MRWSIVTSLGASAGAVILIACVLSTSTVVEANKRVPKPIIQVYYESLCGDSRRFITRQLYPLKTSPLGEYFYVQLIPYGKATTRQNGDTYSFDCQHGPDECRGNKLHACAIRHLNESQSFEFVYCSMAAQFPPNALNDCASRVGASSAEIERIQECTSSSEGSELLARHGERTHSLSPKLYFVPWITISGIFNQDKFQQSLSDLKTVVCRELHNEGKSPEACEGLDLSLPVRYNSGGNANQNERLSIATISVLSFFFFVGQRYLIR